MTAWWRLMHEQTRARDATRERESRSSDRMEIILTGSTTSYHTQRPNCHKRECRPILTMPRCSG